MRWARQRLVVVVVAIAWFLPTNSWQQQQVNNQHQAPTEDQDRLVADDRPPDSDPDHHLVGQPVLIDSDTSNDMILGDESSSEPKPDQLNGELYDVQPDNASIETNSSSQSTVNNTKSTIDEMIKVNCTPVLASAVGSGVDGDQRHDNITANESMTIPVASVKMVNSSALLEYLQPKNISLPSNTTSPTSVAGQCSVVLFYYRSCPFCARIAPRFNALGRLFPEFHVLAFDAYGHNSINMRFGLVGVPSVLFFHNGKIVGKLNETDASLQTMINYIRDLSGRSPDPKKVLITQQDMEGPVKIDIHSRSDYLLWFCWLFCIGCLVYFFSRSSLFKTIVETVRNNWREAEAQHEHID